MKTTQALALLLACAILQPFISISQCMIYPVSFEQRVANSASIVQGKVIAKHAYLDLSGNIYTLNTIKVNAWLKGYNSMDEVQVITEGGVYEDKATVVYPSLQLSEKSEYIFFLEANNRNKDDKTFRGIKPSQIQAMAYSGIQGAIKNESNKYRDYFSKASISENTLFSKITKLTKSRVLTPSGKEFSARKALVTTNAKVLSVIGISPSSVNGGTILPGDEITITGSGFGAVPGDVLFTSADDGGSTSVSSGVPSDIISWSDNSITVKVPSGGGTGPVTVSTSGNGDMVSPSSLAIGYTHIEINNSFNGFPQTTRQRYYLRNLNGSGGYTFVFNTSFNSNTAAVNAFNRAMASWRNSTGVNFITGGTTAVTTSANDGVNAVFFDASLPAGVLGMALSHFQASANGGCNGVNTVWWAADIDIRFAPDPPFGGLPWQFGPALANGSQIDFESVAVHEIGHAAGLGHRIATGEVMNWVLSNGMNVRTPSATEKNGVTAKLSYSTSTTCFDPAGSGTPMVLAPIILPVEFISFSGERKNNSTDILYWKVAQETGNAGYAIERSADGSNFSKIGFVDPSLANEEQKSYSYSDVRAGIYPWYYRLKQMDISGSYSYSKTIFIKGDKNSTWRVFASEDGNTIHIYGNPAGNAVGFQLVSSSGQEIMRKIIDPHENVLVTNNLAKGVYHYRVMDNDNKVMVSGSLLLGN